MPRKTVGLGLALLLLLAAAVAAAERDPDYDRILEAYKGKQWSEVAKLAPAFLTAKPDYKYAHSVRYMLGRSLESGRRYGDAAEAFREYVERHPDGKYADRCWSGLVSCLNLDSRHEEALAAAEEYLAKHPDGRSAAQLTYERAYALEGLRRFDEAVAAYGKVVGSRKEKAAYRTGVALFRGRDFKAARKALERFLRDYPKSSYERAARDYLFRTDTGFKSIEDGVVRDYSGKYGDDPRFAALLDRIEPARAAAVANIEEAIGRRVPDDFLIRLGDADGSDMQAVTRIEVVKGKPRHVVVVHTEYLMMGAVDLERTLTHELYHCLQRDSLGEDHFLAPKWVREGTALYVAGQGETRTRIIAAELGRRRESVAEAMERLVDGLDGRHDLNDYAEDVSAFLAVEKRHGKEKLVRLLKRLLRTSDVEAAVGEVLGEDMETFERRTDEYARAFLLPLLTKGHAEVRASVALLGKRDYEGALKALPEDAGIYDAATAYMRGLILMRAGRPEEALTAIRKGYLERHRRYAPLTDNALYLEVMALKELGSPALPAAAARARKDLEPTSAHEALQELLGS